MAIEPVNVTPGDGIPVAADKVGDDYFQYVKLDLGADGVSDPAVTNLPVTVQSLPGTATAGGTVAPTTLINVGGWDGTNNRAFKTTATGQIEVKLSDTPVFTGSGTFVVSDALRINVNASPYASSVRSATPTAFAVTNTFWSTARLYLNVTAAPTAFTDTLQVALYDVDPASGLETASTAFTATLPANNAFWATVPRMFVFDLGPGAVALNSQWQADTKALPALFHIKVLHSAAHPWTYSLGLALNL